MNAIGSKIYIFAGVHKDYNRMNDMVIYNCLSNKWIYPEQKGDIPCCRNCHANVV